MVVESGKEVAVDGHDQGRTAKLHAANEPLQEFEPESSLGPHDGSVSEMYGVYGVDVMRVGPEELRPRS